MNKKSLLTGLACAITAVSAQAAPGKPNIDWMPSTQQSGENISVKWHMWWGTNGTSWSLKEGNQTLCSQTIVANGKNEQSASCSADYSAGSHTVVVSLCDNNGCTDSSPITLNVINGASTSNKAPTVELAPVAAEFTVGDQITLQADAQDIDGTVASVQFYVNDVLVGTDTSAPFSFNHTAALGDATISAVATDNDGATTASGSLTIQVNDAINVPPTVSVQSPATAVEGDIVTLNAVSEDVDGVVAAVEFLVDGISLGFDTTAPYSIDYTAVEGNHLITAVSTDDLGFAATSEAASLVVSPIIVENQAPTVGITAPTTTWATVGDILSLEAEASDIDGNVVSVDFYVDNQLVGTDSQAPYSAQYTAQIGRRFITAIATDNEGAATTSGAYEIEILNVIENQAPSVTVSNAATATQGDVVLLEADASDVDGFVSSVEFYVDGVLVSTDTSTPYAANYSAVEGTHSITAVATDDDNASTTSVARSLEVTPIIVENMPPMVSVAAPTGALANTLVALEASASDADGMVSTVEFFIDGISVGTDATAPFSVDYSAVEGSFSLTAKATDNDNASTTSTPVNFSVSANGVSHEECRPEGLFQTPGVNTPYCTVYQVGGIEKPINGSTRRVIGYFTNWRHGKGAVEGQPTYLATDVSWDKVTHINYAFAHIDNNYRVSVGEDIYPTEPGYVVDDTNPNTGMVWNDVPGATDADMDPAYKFNGHLNLLNKYKKQNGVKTLISVGGWAETGAFWGPNTGSACPLTDAPAPGDVWTMPGQTDKNGNINDGVCPVDDLGRVVNGGFYSMTTNSDGTVNQAGIEAFAKSSVDFIRAYGFDGVDIDYEYPTALADAGNPYDRAAQNPRRAGLWASYTVLMEELRKQLDIAGVEDGVHYYLTVAVPSSGYLLRGMEVFSAAKYLDFINMMTYDFAGSWGSAVGHNSSLYDSGKEPEMINEDVYAAYGKIGYLNIDWAFHYFRGLVPPGRINVGLPYYSRGWQGVSGGDNGYGGSAGTNDCERGTGLDGKQCGKGAVGIDNVWFDPDSEGIELPAGSNPMWHIRNLADNKTPTYMEIIGKDLTDPINQLSGNYVQYNDNEVAMASWLWNAEKKVYLTIEGEDALQAKANYVADKGIGGIMFWEMAGDYDCYAYDEFGVRTTNKAAPSVCAVGNGEYFIGDTLTTKGFNTMKAAGNYSMETTDPLVVLPTQKIDVEVKLVGYVKSDDNAWPQTSVWKFVNNSAETVTGIEFSITSSTDINGDMTASIGGTQTNHANQGGNTGAPGMKDDFHRFTKAMSIAPGASSDLQIDAHLPIGGGPVSIIIKTAAGDFIPQAEFKTITQGTCADRGLVEGEVPTWKMGISVKVGDIVFHNGKFYQMRWGGGGWEAPKDYTEDTFNSPWKKLAC